MCIRRAPRRPCRVVVCSWRQPMYSSPFGHYLCVQSVISIMKKFIASYPPRTSSWTSPSALIFPKGRVGEPLVRTLPRLLMLAGEVVFEAPPMGSARLRSGRRLGGNRMPTVMENNKRKNDSDEEEEEVGLNDTWAPRIARRGVPRRRSREQQPSPNEMKQPAPVIAKKSLTPPPRLSPVQLIRSGASDLFSNMEVASVPSKPSDAPARELPSSAARFAAPKARTPPFAPAAPPDSPVEELAEGLAPKEEPAHAVAQAVADVVADAVADVAAEIGE